MENYAKIPSLFSFASQELYTKVANQLQEGTIVEIGAYLGKSTAFMASQIAGRNITFHVVDTWKGSTDDSTTRKARELGGDMFPTFKRNLESVGLYDTLICHQMPSVEAAKLFPNEHFDFIYIDGDHTYPFVSADIKAWLPKLKKDGIIAGDDLQAEGVTRAVNE